MKKLKTEKGEEKKIVENIMKKLEVEVRIEGIKCIKASREEKGGMFIVRLANKEDKRI